jgi:hypothetical protein
MVNNFPEKLQKKLPVGVKVCVQAHRWISKQSIEVFLLCKEVEREIYFKLKSSYSELTINELSLLASLLAAHKLRYAVTNKVALKGVSIDYEAFEIQKRRRPHPKRKMEWLLNHQAIISKMRDQKLSLREISHHLEDRFGMTISRTYIGTFVKEYL